MPNPEKRGQLSAAISVEKYLDMVHQSLSTIDPAHRELRDVQMLLSTIDAMERGLLNMVRQLQEAEDVIEGLRARIRTGSM